MGEKISDIDRKPTLQEVTEVIQKAMLVAQTVSATYGAAIEFLDSKGLMDEFEDYYKQKFLKNQKPEGN